MVGGVSVSQSSSGHHDGLVGMIRRRIGARSRGRKENARENFDQEMHQLLGSMLAALGKNKSIIVAITGCMSKEGSSTISYGLASVASKAGFNVLVVDGRVNGEDLRDGPPAFLVGPDNVHQVSNEIIVDLGPKLVHRTGFRNLVPAVATAEQVSATAESLRGDYSLVIFDCPPICEGGDAGFFAAAADGAVLVVETGHTRVPVVKQGCRALEAAGANVLGIVLNKRDYHIPDFVYRCL